MLRPQHHVSLNAAVRQESSGSSRQPRGKHRAAVRGPPWCIRVTGSKRRGPGRLTASVAPFSAGTRGPPAAGAGRASALPVHPPPDHPAGPGGRPGLGRRNTGTLGRRCGRDPSERRIRLRPGDTGRAGRGGTGRVPAAHRQGRVRRGALRDRGRGPRAGDVLVVSAGNRVCADARIIEGTLTLVSGRGVGPGRRSPARPQRGSGRRAAGGAPDEVSDALRLPAPPRRGSGRGAAGRD